MDVPLAEVRPAAGPAAPAAKGPAAGAAPFEPAPTLRGLRVLVVEDQADTRAAIRWLLEQCGADVTAVESAALAVAAFRDGLAHRPFDLIVSDIGMPVQDGYELMSELRQMERGGAGEQHLTPAVAMTAYARDEDRAKATAAGFQTHLPKPVDPSRLVEALRG